LHIIILYLKPKCGDRISDAHFLIVFLSNYRPVLLSFRDVISTGGTMADKSMMATIAILSP